MNTTQLECFITVARHLNFSRASQILRITQPAVSHQIRTLEEELDTRLFQRTSRSVALTPEGIRFLPDAELMLKTALSAKERLGHHINFVFFEVGCHSRMELDVLPPVFQKMAESFPLLRPSVRIVPFPSLYTLIDNQKLFAAFGIKENEVPSSLSFRQLCMAPIACVCAPSHPLAHTSSLTFDMLSGSFAACSPHQIPSPLFALYSRILPELSPDQQYLTENLESVLSIVKAGLAYTIYPDIPLFRDPDLCYCTIADLPSLPFGIFYRHDNNHEVLKTFVRLCKDTFSSPTDFSGTVI